MRMCLFAAVTAAGFWAGIAQAATETKSGQTAFDLKELSLCEAIRRESQLAYSGQRVYLGFEKTEFTEDSTKPEKEVKKYPSSSPPSRFTAPSDSPPILFSRSKAATTISSSMPPSRASTTGCISMPMAISI